MTTQAKPTSHHRGGSAGAALAARISEDPQRTVLLIEAGPDYPSDQYPKDLLAPQLLPTQHDWGYTARATDRARASPHRAPDHGRQFRGERRCRDPGARGGLRRLGRALRDQGLSYEEVLPTSGTWRTRLPVTTLPRPYRPLPRQAVDVRRTHLPTAGVRGQLGGPGVPAERRLQCRPAGRHRRLPVNIVDGVRQNTALVYLTPQVPRRPT